jgi:hypothetical protein
MAVRWHKPLQIAVAGLSSLDSELVLAKTSKSTVSEPMVCGKLSYLCRMFANMLAWYVNNSSAEDSGSQHISLMNQTSQARTAVS